MKLVFVYFCCAAVMLLGGEAAWGQISIFTNPITGTDPGLTSPYSTGQVLSNGLTSTGISRGAGLGGNAANNRYNANNWTVGAFVIGNNDYFEWNLSPSAGYAIDLTSFVYTGQVSSGGPSFNYRTSIDSFAANVGSPATTGATINFTAPDFQNLTTSTTLRLYGFNFAAAGTTYSVNDFTYNGLVSIRWNGAADGNLTNTGNYVNSNSINSGNGIQFEGSTNTTVSVDAATAIAGIRFASGANSFTINGPAALTLGSAGGVYNYSTNAQTINADIVLGATQIVSTNAGSITFGGNISGASFGLTKSGSGTVVLSGTNSYSGATTVTAGLLRLDSASGLSGGIGSTGGTSSLVFNGTGIVGLANGDFSRELGSGASQVLFTGGGGFAAFGANRNVDFGGSSATVTWATATTGLNGQTLFLGAAAADSTVIVQNPLNLGAAVRTVSVANGSASSDAELSGQLTGTGAGGLTKLDAGTLVLSNPTNSYTGVTSVNAGVLRLNSDTALPGGIGTSGGASNLTINGGVVGLGSGNFTRSLGTGADQVQFTANGSGFVAFGADRTVNFGGAGASITWSAVGTGFGGFQLNLGATNSTHKVTVENALNMDSGPGFTIRVNDGAAAIDGEVSGAIAGSSTGRSLTVTGTGTLLLSNTNSSFTGAFIVNGGATAIIGGRIAGPGSQSSIGAGGSGAANLVINNGTLRFDPSVLTAQSTGRLFTIGVGSATIEASAADAATTMTFSSTGDIAFSTADTAVSLTLGGTNTGNNTLAPRFTNNGTAATSLVKAGAGTWVLMGANTYTGATSINAGTLVVNGIQSSAIGNVTVANSATLAGSGTIGGAVTVQAGGTIRGASGTGTGNLNLGATTQIIGGPTTTGATLATQLTTNISGAITANSKLAMGTSTLNLDSTGGKFNITLLNDSGLNAEQFYTINLATSTTVGGSFLRNGSAWDPSLNPFTTADFNVISGSGSFTSFDSLSLSVVGNNLVLGFTPSPVPEPHHVLLLAAFVLGAGFWLHRRSMKLARSASGVA